VHQATWQVGTDAVPGCGGRRVGQQGGHLYAVVADTAVRTAWGAVEVAGGTPFHADLDAPHVHILVQWRPEVVLLVLVLVRCRSRARQGSKG
jgi:hypothetical protein